MAMRTERRTSAHLAASAMDVSDFIDFRPCFEHRRTSADVTFDKVPITKPSRKDFLETGVRRRPPSACGRAGLERVGDILVRLAAGNPEQWAWLLDSQAEQKEAA